LPIQKNSVEYIRTVLDSHIGERITVKANEGRKRISITEGVLERTYPSFFTVRVDDEYGRTATWSYVDVLTDSVEIKFGDDAQDVPADN